MSRAGISIKKRIKKAFTLIEVLIVLGIAAIVAAGKNKMV